MQQAQQAAPPQEQIADKAFQAEQLRKCASDHTLGNRKDTMRQPSSRELHEAARAAALQRRRPPVQPHPQSHANGIRGDGSSADLSAIMHSVEALQRKLEDHQLLSHRDMASLGKQDLSQVAAAAAAAAAQTVKQESHDELSQVLKAVLLQQSRLGAAPGMPHGGALMHPMAQSVQDNVHVHGQLLIPPAGTGQAPSSATPHVRIQGAMQLLLSA